jgi:hypothetical protein
MPDWGVNFFFTHPQIFTAGSKRISLSGYTFDFNHFFWASPE